MCFMVLGVVIELLIKVKKPAKIRCITCLLMKNGTLFQDGSTNSVISSWFTGPLEAPEVRERALILMCAKLQTY